MSWSWLVALMVVLLQLGCTGIALPFAAASKSQKPFLAARPAELAALSVYAVADHDHLSARWNPSDLEEELECALVVENVEEKWVPCTDGNWQAGAQDLQVLPLVGELNLKIRYRNWPELSRLVRIQRFPERGRGLSDDDGPASVHAIEASGDGSFFVGGRFSFFNARRIAGGIPLRVTGPADDIIPRLRTGFTHSTPNQIATVRAVVKVDDGYIVGGRFTHFNGQPLGKRHLVKLDFSGRVVQEWSTALPINMSATVSGVWDLQKFQDPNGEERLLVAGELGGANLSILDAADLSVVQSISVTGIPRKARYYPPSAGGNPARLYMAVATGNASGLAFRAFQWVDASSSWSTAFGITGAGGLPGATGTVVVNDFEVLPDDSIAIVGNFVGLNNGALIYDSSGLGVVNFDGTISTQEQPVFDAEVTSIELGIQESRAYVGGYFEEVSYTRLPRLASLRRDGTRFIADTVPVVEFDPSSGSRIDTLLRDGNTLWMGGQFQYLGQAQNLLAVTLEPHLVQLPQALRVGRAVERLSFVETGVVFAGISGLGSVGGQAVSNNLVKVDSKFQVDPSFAPSSSGFNHEVKVVRKDGDGVFVGGDFSNFNGEATPVGLVRLSSSGSLDTSFGYFLENPLGGATEPWTLNPNNPYQLRAVNAVLRLDADRILVGGNFAKFNGESRNGLAVLNDSGQLRSEVIALPAGSVVTVLEPLGSAHILIGVERSPSVSASHAFILNRSLQGPPQELRVGTVVVADHEVLAAATRTVELEGSSYLDLILGGGFRTLQRAAHLRFTLDAQGAIDPSSVTELEFPDFSTVVSALHFSATGDLYVGGNFDQVTPPNNTTPLFVRVGVARFRSNSIGAYRFDSTYNAATQAAMGLQAGSPTTRVYALSSGAYQGADSGKGILVGSQNTGVWLDDSSSRQLVYGLMSLLEETGLWNPFFGGSGQTLKLE
jgi:hypothetical protein